MSMPTAGTSSAAIGISIETTEQVDKQMATLKNKNEGGLGESDMDVMQVEGGSNNDESMALVRRGGGTDVAMQANMAVALAPRIGK